MDEKNEIIKFIFKPLQYNKSLNNSTDSKNNIYYKDYTISFNNNKIYDYLESCNPPRIINIKLCFFSYLQNENKDNAFPISLDSVILYAFIDNKYTLLNDCDIYNEIIDEDKDNVIYYNFNENKINIKIEFFSNSIDNFYFNLSEMCSIFMIKYLIYLKLKNIEAINNYKTLSIKKEPSKIDTKKYNNNEQQVYETIINDNNNKSFYNRLIKINEIENVIKLYGNGIINREYKKYNNKNETNRNFFDNTLLLNVLNYYLSFSRNCYNNNDENSDSNNSNNIIKKSREVNININANKIRIFNNTSEYTLSFIMTECKKDKLILGLDFRFNLLNYLSPYYLEDEKKHLINNKKCINKSKILLYNGGGLKLFLYCLNDKCIYHSKYFVYHLGYGFFDIFNSMSNISCPICKKKGNKLIELKYIGMLNAKWIYKGFLTGLKLSNVEGQGITILKDVVYRTNEIIFSQQFISLNFLIEKYFSNNYIKEEKQKKLTSINSTYFTDNSYYSNITEEEDSKIISIDKSKCSENNKTIPVKAIRNKIKRIVKKKYKNRNHIISLNNTYKNGYLSSTSKCEINDLVVNKDNSCWGTCFDEDKNNNECFIF